MSSSTPPSPSPSTDTGRKDVQDALFNSPDADIIIRSSDGCAFRVHRLILSLGSVTFKDMFAAQAHTFLPSLAAIAMSNDSESDDFKDGLPVVRLTETSRTLRTLLQLLYPGDHPEISGRAAIIAIVNAMDKYMVDGYPKFIAAALRFVLVEAPHLVLAFAFRHKLSFDLRSRAAYHTLLSPAIAISDDVLELLAPFQYHQILVYHHQCTLQASVALKKLDWTRTKWAEVSVGSRKEGTSIYLAKNTVGCTCSRTLRVHKSNTSESGSGEKSEQNVYVAFWAAEFITSLEAYLWCGPHWTNIKNAERNAAVQGAEKCETCKPNAERELKLIAAHLANEVRLAILKVCHLCPLRSASC